MWRECKFHCRLWDARVDEAIHSFGCLSRFAEQRCIGLLYYKYTLFNLAVVFNFIFQYIYIFFTTFSDGCLGSRNDEERSEMRYVMRIAEFSESSNLWTHIALPLTREHSCLSVCSLLLCLSQYVGELFGISRLRHLKSSAKSFLHVSTGKQRDDKKFVVWSWESRKVLAETRLASQLTQPIRPQIRKEDPLNLSI